MRRTLRCFVVLGFLLFSALEYASARVIVFQETGFPAMDAPPPSRADLAQSLPGAEFHSAAELPQALAQPDVQLLVLPYGPAFPEADWQAIDQFLEHGGNLLTLGGRAFTRPNYLEHGRWEMRPETYAFARRLFLSDYQEVGPSRGLVLQPNHDALEEQSSESLRVWSSFSWREAYSLVIRLSDEATSPRAGASGTPDSQLRTLVWGRRGTHAIAAPIVEIDHFRNHFAGGRWVMLNCDLAADFAASPVANKLIAALALRASRGASQFSVIPSYPLYLPSEPPAFHVEWERSGALPAKATIHIAISNQNKQEGEADADLDVRSFPVHQQIALPGAYPAGFHTVVAQLQCDSHPCGTYRTGFWVRDEAYLASGPRVTVNRDSFEIDGKPIVVVGTTYMASDAQRLFLRYPNPYVWDQDLAQISADGMNMLRTGLWTDWDTATGGTGVASERTLRTIEAYLMTARRYNLPVQFNLFAFMPEVFGGVNPYLDPEALRRERIFVQSVVQRFRSVPFLMWDLINEPSFDNPQHFFTTKANGDAAEEQAWNNWLLTRYGSRDAIASQWSTVLSPGAIPVPQDADFQGQSSMQTSRVLSVYDFDRFAQEMFAGWAQQMRQSIRDIGSSQMITVGQDEGGGLTSPSPAYFALSVDFTTMHSWWFNDDLLWDSLVAKQPGKPMLVQETGVQNEADLDGRSRRTLQNEAALLERKVGIALGTGAGAIEWLWNINARMQSQQEVTIGAVRWDGTEKPEANVLRAYGAFAATAGGHFKEAAPEDVAILTSQALQYSAMTALATTAQKAAVRILNYDCRVPARVVAENQVERIAGSKLVVLPSPQALGDAAWSALLRYTENGGNLLITGPVERDEHWQRTQRLRQLGIAAIPSALTAREDRIDLGGEIVDATFPQLIQQHAESWRLPAGQSYLEVQHGKGTIYLTAVPVELAESPSVSTAVYRHVLSRIGWAPAFTVSGASASVLVRPRRFADSILYLLVSESDRDEQLTIRDAEATAPLQVNLPAQRAKLVLLQKGSGRVIAAYAGPDLNP